MNQAITNGIRVSVDTYFRFVQERNAQKHFLFDYFVLIENLSHKTVKLTQRHWEIYDSLNYTEIVEGYGVIGEQPVLKPGETHSYKSHCILNSNCGSMKGYYKMINLEENEEVKVKIPTFQFYTKTILN